jgi:hypothetical protein
MMKELVSKTLTPACPSDQPCYIDIGNRCRDNLFRLKYPGQGIEPFIRYLYNPAVAFNRAEWII